MLGSCVTFHQILMLFSYYNLHCASDTILFASYESLTKVASYPVNSSRKSVSPCNSSSFLKHKVLFRETHENDINKDDTFEFKKFFTKILESELVKEIICFLEFVILLFQ